MTAHQLVRLSAAIVFGVGVAYALALVVGIASVAATEPIHDPILAVMEVLTVLSALPIVVLTSALHTIAPAHRKPYSLVAVAFATLFAGTTSAVHFVGLTSGRQLGTGTIVWPSTAYAVELLAWDLFLGIALIAIAAVFDGTGQNRTARRGLLLAGALCLLGVVGPAVGDMRLQRVGVVGYAVVLPLVCLYIFRLFGDGRATGTGRAAAPVRPGPSSPQDAAGDRSG